MPLPIGTAAVAVKAADEKNYTNKAVWEYQVLAAADGNVKLKADITYKGRNGRAVQKRAVLFAGWEESLVNSDLRSG